MSFSCPVLKLCFYICQRKCAHPTPVRNRPKKNSIQRKRGGLHTVSRIKCRHCTFLQATDTLSLEFPYVSTFLQYVTYYVQIVWPAYELTYQEEDGDGVKRGPSEPTVLKPAFYSRHCELYF